MNEDSDKSFKCEAAKKAMRDLDFGITCVGEEFDNLNRSVYDATQKFYNDLYHEINISEYDPDTKQKYEDIYVDVLGQWKEDIHNIEVHMIQLSQWLKNERKHGFSPKLWKLKRTLHEQLFNPSPTKTNQKPIKRLQSGRNRSAKSINSVFKNDPNETEVSKSQSKLVYVTNVKINRTMELRKAMTEKRQQKHKNDPIYAKPDRKRYKNLQKYAKEDVYNRLTRTTTIAYDNQQKGKNIVKDTRNKTSKGSMENKSSSFTSTKKRVVSSKLKKSKRVSSSAKQFSNPKENIPIQTSTDTECDIQRPPSRIPRPTSKLRRNPRNNIPDTRGSGNNNKLLKEKWTVLTSSFPPKDAAKDDFSDLKNSTNNAEKIYGKPKKTGKWMDFFRRNLSKKKDEKDSDKENKNENMKETGDESELKANEPYDPISGNCIQDSGNAGSHLTALRDTNIHNITNKNTKVETKINENGKENEVVFLAKAKVFDKKPKSAGINGLNSCERQEALSVNSDENSSLEARRSKSDHVQNKGTKTGNGESISVKTENPKRNHKSILSKLQQRKASKAIPNKSTNESKANQNQGQNISNFSKDKANTKKMYKTNRQTLPPLKNAPNKTKNITHASPYENVKGVKNNGTLTKQKMNPTKTTTRAKNKPKSQIIRNTLGVDVEEFNIEPSSQHVFTRCSDSTENNILLAKLDERFNRQKQRVEAAVKKNQMDLYSDIDSDDEYESYYSDDNSSSDDPAPPNLAKQTMLLKQHINKIKQDLLNNELHAKSHCTASDTDHKYGTVS